MPRAAARSNRTWQCAQKFDLARPMSPSGENLSAGLATASLVSHSHISLSRPIAYSQNDIAACTHRSDIGSTGSRPAVLARSKLTVLTTANTLPRAEV